MEARIRMTIETPLIPAFVRTSEGERIHVSRLDDDMLRALGDAWTAKLLKYAAQQRAEPRP